MSTLLPTVRRRLDGDAGQHYRNAVEHVTGQLATQLDAAPGESCHLALVPSVGFGEQSAPVLGRTLDVLCAQRSPAPLRVVVLVNRPEARPPDSTEAIARRAADAAGRAGATSTIAVASLMLPRRPRLGELRQILLDAAQEVLRRRGARSEVAIVLDDDVVAAPRDFIERLTAPLGGPRELAVGSVLFDDPSFPSALLPDFLAGDLLRALLADAWVEIIEGADLSSASERAALVALAREHHESIVLSCNLAVRTDALERVGGFRDVNEITGVARDLQERRLAASEPRARVNAICAAGRRPPPGTRVTALLEQAVRISSRRALAAHALGHPSVAQWRACRFRASRVDPVRVAARPARPVLPMRRMRRSGLAALVARIERALVQTLSYFPPDRAVAAECLAELGLGPGNCRLTLTSAPGAAWSFSIAQPAGMLARLAALQDGVGSTRPAAEQAASPWTGG